MPYAAISYADCFAISLSDCHYADAIIDAAMPPCHIFTPLPPFSPYFDGFFAAITFTISILRHCYYYYAIIFAIIFHIFTHLADID
jgi:hypothetical protein